MTAILKRGEEILTCRRLRRVSRLFLMAAISLVISVNAMPQKAVLIVQAGHSDRIVDAVFSRDGKLLATAGSMRIVKVWEAATGILLKTLDASDHHVEDDEFWPLSYVPGI